MRENIWKYVSAVLALLLALSVVAIAVLYQATSPIEVLPNATAPAVVETPLNVTCNGTSGYQLSQLKDEIIYLRSLINGTGGETIAVVPIFGIINEYTALEVVPLLRKIASNDSIRGVLLWIESPGGDVGPVIDIYSEVKKLALVKPVVAYSGGIMASGGYYIAVGANKIIASPLAEVGSIGVLYVHYNYEKNYELNGIEVEVFKTGSHKDMGAEWRGLTDEEKKIIANMVNTYFQAFLQAVSEGRNMSVSEVKKFATGRTWFAENVTGTLVDETGGMDTAIATLEKLMNVTSARVVIYKNLETPSNFGITGSKALYLDPSYLEPYLRR
ncbi:signal peptide peptidase SppA [Thermococcus sp.]|uniref:signal peptide peptidase SppA n=1 Tax=Thermococcus sp. TaxID=35749 RepID=UPI00260702B7|nr:signal peptide peptidase SppA [Thermococcus sp.]